MRGPSKCANVYLAIIQRKRGRMRTVNSHVYKKFVLLIIEVQNASLHFEEYECERLHDGYENHAGLCKRACEKNPLAFELLLPD